MQTSSVSNWVTSLGALQTKEISFKGQTPPSWFLTQEITFYSSLWFCLVFNLFVLFLSNNYNPWGLPKGVYYRPYGLLSFWPLASMAFLSRMLIFLPFTNMTRTSYAASGILPLGAKKEKEKEKTLKAVLYWKKLPRKINSFDDPRGCMIILELKMHCLF